MIKLDIQKNIRNENSRLFPLRVTLDSDELVDIVQTIITSVNIKGYNTIPITKEESFLIIETVNKHNHNLQFKDKFNDLIK